MRAIHVDMNGSPRPEVRVKYRDLHWEVSVDGHARPMIDSLCTKVRAIAHAVERAEALAAIEGVPVDLVIESIEGMVETEMRIEPRRAVG